ncbi:uncharacterized protein LOC142231487 [Haematobia irritans]|uniref:uncharacterized protein LOC142231487 n=1 Tax=Haematobia irritans TaxID=7368 RepID=UPI003F4FC8BF
MNLEQLLVNLTLTSWQFLELEAIISAANRLRSIDTLIFFGDKTQVDFYVGAVEELKIPKIVIGENHITQLQGFNRNLFFVAIGSLMQRSLWTHMNSSLSKIQSRVRGVFITSPTNREEFYQMIHDHMKRCWLQGLINTVVLVDKYGSQHFEIYNYNPFLMDTVLNVTNESKSALHPDKFRNLHKYKIRIIAQFDPPRVFERRACNGKETQQLSGYVGKMFRAFLKEYNASRHILHHVANKTVGLWHLIELIKRGDVDLSINPFVPYPGVQLSYPIRMLQRCVVVPSANELPKYRYFIMPFHKEVWLSYLASWLVLSLARLSHRYWNHESCSTCRCLDVGKVFLNVGRLLISLPVPTSACNQRRIHWYYMLWFLQVMALSFILTNLYLASLTTFFSSLFLRPQISTLAELVERQLPIETIEYANSFIEENQDLPKGFLQLIKPRNGQEFLKDVLAVCPDQVYSSLSDRIQFALHQETHLIKRSKHIVQECLSTVPFGFVMPLQSHFKIPLDRFILRCYSAGLVGKWIEESLDDAYCMGLLIMRNPKFIAAKPLILQDFQFAWYVLTAGYFLSLLCFVMEHVCRALMRCRIFIIYY